MDLSRRAFVAATAVGTLLPAAARGEAGSVTAALSPFASDFMRYRNAPGMIVGVADRQGWSETAAFGSADIDSRRPIRPDERFHIGSISKSFAALMILQLVEEGKVALDADVTRYLPGLPLRTGFGPVTVHHLLCHASGLQSEVPAPGDSGRAIEQAFAPGSRFHYSNLGYAWLGRIVVAQGGEDWTRALHRRVLDPLGMAETSTLIGAGMRRWEVPSYVRREDDRPFTRSGALTRAAPLNFTAASGCIASTARDMNKYVAVIARGGDSSSGRLLSPEMFGLMTKRHIAAAEFGPGGGYGYGWMTGEVDGQPVIRHTGGMNSFMSSIHVDLAAGCGAFASINAQQNYRPVPVTAYALGLCRARVARSSAPKPPAADPGADLAVEDYVGDYLREDGSVARIAAAGPGLALQLGGTTLTLEQLSDDQFACVDPRNGLSTFLFRRERPLAEAKEGEPNRVLSLGWGRDTLLRRGARSPAYPASDLAALSPAALGGYEGLYVADGGWLTALRVVVRDGRLWVDSFDGAVPLAHLGDGRFRFADEADSPEVAIFSGPPGSRTLSISGNIMTRVGTAFAELA